MSLQVIQMTEQRFREHLMSAARLGAHEALRAAGLPVREHFTRTEMERRHGKQFVRQLISKGKLTPHQHADDPSARIVYSETELLQNII